MKTFKFKTNLKCNNCVAKVKSQLDITDEIQSWSIDLKSPDRILTIKAKDEKAVASVERILAEAGYLAEVYPVESYITKNDKTMKDVKKESDKQSKPTTIKGCGCGNTEKPGKSQKMANDETTEDDIQGASNYERAESDQSKGIFAQQTKAYNKTMDELIENDDQNAKDNLSEADWEDVEDTLLLADVGADASAQLVDDLRTDARITGKADPAEVRATLKEKLLDLVGRDTDRRLNAEKPGAAKPSVIIMVGVNGTGKTTTAGKLARLFVAENKQVMMGAADTFRAAAADQLETWGARVNVPVVRSDKDGADPASVAFEASAKAKEANADVLIIDTAGRLQNKSNLMDELGKIRRVTEKNLPVDEVLLVLDATTGQNGMAQAKVFAEAIGITGVVLSKLDGSAKGGIVISVQKELGVPVKLVGLGEGPDDLAPFDPEGFVDGILA